MINTDQSTVPSMLPFLKWAGGKRALSSQILPNVEMNNGTYFEPFLGGGAIFFALGPKKAVLSDVNCELIECYRALRDEPEALAIELSRMSNTKDNYYKVRQSRPCLEINRAARFIYLTSLSFNGIYRQNLQGVFNVPYGYKMAKKMPSFEELLAVSLKLRNVELNCHDFEVATEKAVLGDTVYFDPPYTVAHNNNGFIKYNASMFSWEDQLRLATHALQLVSRGCRVIVSNADHISVRELYEGFRTLVVHRNSVIAASSAKRGKITECLFVSE